MSPMNHLTAEINPTNPSLNSAPTWQAAVVSAALFKRFPSNAFTESALVPKYFPAFKSSVAEAILKLRFE
jgi:hypothetical protein